MSNKPSSNEPPPTTEALRLLPPRLPRLIFTVALFAYIVAVTQRSSLGVAGVDAADRFMATATELSALGVMQVAVYAIMQIPVGMLLDRFGARRLIMVGAVLMAIGQCIVALAPSIEVAVIGRVLVGAGDATTFVSGLRILAAWFPPRRVPIMQQWYGNLGQIGQFLSAVPFSTLLHLGGWTTAFFTTASLSVIVVIAAIVWLRDTPYRGFAGEPLSIRGAFDKLGQAFARPGTRLGFWAHFATQFPGTVFGLLWGFPIMVQGLGYSTELAAVLVIAPVIAGMAIGPFIGLATAKWPMRRSNLVIFIVLVQAAFWIACIIWPDRPPMWLFLLTLVITGVGGTGSTIGFDFARTFNPASSYGSASGIVNVGGFTASSVTFLLIGLGIDFAGRAGDGTTPWSSFQFALWAFPLVMAFGLIGLAIERRRTRSRLAAEEGITVAPLWTAIMRRRRRRRV